MLTTSELKQVKHYLELYSKKDSQLPAVPVDLEHPEGIFTAEDYLAIVQDADNKIITIKNLEKVFLLTFLTDEDFREALKGKIPEEMLENACVTTEKLADGAVTTIKLGNSAVTTAKIATGAITGDKIANDTIQGAAFAINSITSDKIVDGTVTGDKLANGAIESVDLQDGTLNGSKIVDNSIPGSKLADEAVSSIKIQDNSIDGSKIADGTIQSLDIKDGSISGAKLVNNSITGNKLSNGIITNEKLADNSITGNKFLDESISGEKIQPNSIHGSKLENNTVDGADIISGTLNGSKITDLSIDGEKLVDDSIETRHIKSNTISGSKIANNAIGSEKIRANSLISDNFADGAITNGKIVDNTVTEDKIGTGAVTESKIGTAAVTANKLANNAVTTAKLNDGAVTTAKIVDASVTEGKIADDAVTTAKINNGAVTTDKIPNNNIITAKINDGAVTSDKIPDNAIITSKIADANVTTTKIANGAVTEDKLADGAITTDKLADGLISEIQNITDATPTTGSIKPVQSGGTKTAIDNLNDSKANKDGYYSQMTVGSAENLVGQAVDSEAYLIRPTGGDSNDVANGVASVLGMEGNSCVWNQLIPDNTSGKKVNGIITLTGASTGSYFLVSSGSWVVPAGHKCIFSSNVVKNDNNLYVGGLITWNVANTTFISGTRRYMMIDRTSMTKVGQNMGITVTTGVDYTGVQVTFEQYDLTLMGISSQITSCADFERWLAQHVGTKPYYAYNAGTLLGVQYKGLKALKTPNLLNPTTKTARLFEYTYGNATNKYTISNLPTGSTLYFTPDNTGVEAAVTMDDATHFTVTSQGTLRVDTNDSVINTWLIAYWDGSMDDYSNFEPYQENSNVIDPSYIYYDDNGTKKKVWADGVIKATGSSDIDVKDSLYVDSNDGKWKADIVVGDQDLGAENMSWSYAAPNEQRPASRFAARIPYIKEVPLNSTYSKNLSICNKYRVIREVTSGPAYNSKDKTLYRTNNGGLQGKYVCIHDSGYTSAESFKTAMSGVHLWYELATPIHHDTLYYSEDGENFTEMTIDNFPNSIIVNNWAYEEILVSDYSNNNPTSIPATIKTQYGMDAVEAIDTLQKTCYFADDVKANLQALLTCINTNCSATLGGTFSVSDTATGKVFAFSFTPNE